MAHPISSLEMTIRTGSDELRGDSPPTSSFRTADPPASIPPSSRRKSDPIWSNNSSNGAIIWNLPPGVTHKNVQRFGISLRSHDSGFETHDNWNVNSVLVTYPGPGGAQVPLVQEGGVPLSRLTADSPNGKPPNWPHNVVQTLPAYTATSQRFGTGAAPLRPDS